MIVREIRECDAQGFFEMMCRLDNETEYMMYEPGERLEKSPDISVFKNNIKYAMNRGDLILAAENSDGKIVGFIWAERGALNRIRHTAYIVIGIREAYRHQGLGKTFLEKTDEWAGKENVLRLELTVECQNIAAKDLYEHAGYVIEGERRKAMKVNNSYIDEYYMAKLLKKDII